MLLLSCQRSLDWHVSNMLLEVVSQDLGVSELALEMVWHWHPGHLCAALEDVEALLDHEVHKLSGVWHHDWEEPETSVGVGGSWDVVAHLDELLSHLPDERQFLLVHFICVALCPVDDHGKDGGAWLLSELVDEVAVISEASHPGYPGWLDLTSSVGDVFLHHVASCWTGVDKPDGENHLDFLSVVSRRVELVGVLEALHLVVKLHRVSNMLLGTLPDNGHGTSSSGVMFDGSKTEHGHDSAWVSSEGVDRAETLGAVLQNFNVGTLEGLGDVSAVVGDTVDVGDDDGLGLWSDRSLDVLDGWLEVVEGDLNWDWDAAMLLDDLHHIWNIHASH